jgi:hypothetical protein
MTPDAAALEKKSTFILTASKGDTFTFTHADGREIAVRLMPQTLPDGKIVLYEVWKKGPPGELRRLYTERGYEWVFELPLLLEDYLGQDGYPTDAQALIERFYKNMVGGIFKNYPRDMFR